MLFHPARFLRTALSTSLRLPVPRFPFRAMSSSSPVSVFTDADSQKILDFWFTDCPISRTEIPMSLAQRWFYKSEEFDNSCRDFEPILTRVTSTYTPTTITTLSTTPTRALSLLILFDQLPRNLYRGPLSTRVFTTTDPYALSIALHAITPTNSFHLGPASSPWTKNVAYMMWFVMPFMHSEDLMMMEKGVKLIKELKGVLEEAWGKAEGVRGEKEGMMKFLGFQEGMMRDHMQVVRRFGRYPHRNEAMGRETTGEERRWLGSEERPDWAK